ncbi:preprotein translocase, SecE subunit [Chloroherpeton thalassium ATCC 35110]|uniref:Protein translocase subunit SecE n=1 Tax=Chloroherpeton thalassium (strain ATCC 35110 / GB-78) TaxID=517418 RepID=B3QYK8_CHLT3|nr:preprotein translocase subunit SecE [Chloroherpeton thalassium]ACF13636.1 preprotein translocase, SecE subunit [Chloroherpeton thalassium ATCC 35110]
MDNITGKVVKYYSDVVTEMRKVTWPSQEELKDATIVVLSVSGILAVFTFSVDWIINAVIKQFLN